MGRGWCGCGSNRKRGECKNREALRIVAEERERVSKVICGTATQAL